jgi:hypothetical protein
MKRRNLLIGVLTLPLIITVTPAQACLNDRDSDSLVADSMGLPDTIWIITGRFERNPPIYYQMRIARIQKELAEDPQKLNLYDDIAVAYDRLHKSTEAIKWMEKKKAWMEENVTIERDVEPGETEDWYRYHANIGTFCAHRWLKNKDREHMDDMERGRDHIARGIELKPNAHFARELYQLKAMEWILDGCKDSFGKFMLDTKNEGARDTRKLAASKATEGLSGLVVLGAAWESVDIFMALRSSLVRMDNNKVAYLARLRIEELMKSGKKSLGTEELKPYSNIFDGPVTGRDTLDAQYKMLRSDAEAWHTERTDYMLKRLEAGKHPDTDPNFWSEYKERPKPSLTVPWYQDMGDNLRNWLIGKNGFEIIIFSALVGLVSFIVARKIRHKFRKRG